MPPSSPHSTATTGLSPLIHALVTRTAGVLAQHHTGVPKVKNLEVKMANQNVAEQRASIETCVHHWIVEPAGGPTSGARCRRCGDERFFFNDPEAVVNRDDRPRPGMQSLPEREAAHRPA